MSRIRRAVRATVSKYELSESADPAPARVRALREITFPPQLSHRHHSHHSPNDFKFLFNEQSHDTTRRAGPSNTLPLPKDVTFW